MGNCFPVCCCFDCTDDDNKNNNNNNNTSDSDSYGFKPSMGTYVWIPSAHGSVPPGAVVAGRDKDGSPLYAGRTFHEGDLLPAKISANHGMAYVAHGGGEHGKHEYEVLCSGNVAWQFSRGGDVPPNAIVVGHSEGGEKLYMGRVCHDGSQTPGKIQPSHGVLYIPYAGEEISFPEYEVLVLL